MCGFVSLFGFPENRLRTNKRRCTRHMIVGLSYQTAILRGVQETMQNAVGMTAQCGHQAATAPRRAGLERQYAMQAAGDECDCTSGMSDECRGQCTMQAAPGWAWTHKAGSRLWLLHGEQDLSDHMQWRRQVATARPAAKNILTKERGGQGTMHDTGCPRVTRLQLHHGEQNLSENMQCTAAGCDCTSGSQERTDQGVQATMHNAGCLQNASACLAARPTYQGARSAGEGGGAAARHTRSRAAMQTQTQCSHAAVTKNQTRETTRKNTAGNTDPTATN